MLCQQTGRIKIMDTFSSLRQRWFWPSCWGQVCFICSQRPLNYVFPTVWLWAYLIKVIPEMCLGKDVYTSLVLGTKFPVLLWPLSLLSEETQVYGENHQSAASNRQYINLYHLKGIKLASTIRSVIQNCTYLHVLLRSGLHLQSELYRGTCR